ncbi:MAG TPA: hypothetical protein VGC74_15610 [Stenotrophomonas sp.]|jgi:hypothetical protein
MDQEEGKLAKLGFVIKHYADRSEAAAARMEQGAASLERGANAMLSQGQSLTSAVVNGVKGQVANEIKQSVDRSIAPVHEMLGSDAKSIARIVQELQAEREAIKAERHKWMVIGMGGLATCAVLAFAGIAAWGTYWKNKAEGARAELTWVEAVNSSDFVPCGNKRVCANVDMQAKPTQGKYRPVKQRE